MCSYPLSVTSNIGIQVSVINLSLEATSFSNVWELRDKAFDFLSIGCVHNLEAPCFSEYFGSVVLAFQLFIHNGSIGAYTKEYEVKISFDEKTDKLTNVLFDRVDLVSDSFTTSSEEKSAKSVDGKSRKSKQQYSSSLVAEKDDRQLSLEDISITSKTITEKDDELEYLAGLMEWYIVKVTSNVEYLKDYCTVRSPEFVDSIKSLSLFIKTQELDLNEMNATVAKYSEYITVPDGLKQMFVLDGQVELNKYECKDFVFINLSMPSSDNCKRIGLTSSFLASDPVSKVIAYIQARFKALGQDVDESVAHRKILKVVGQDDYVLHPHFPLYMYDCFMRSIRLQVFLSL